MDAPKVRDQLARETIQTRPMTPEEMTRFMKSEIEKWVPAVKAMNITLQ
jgi:tripartite-type tricarboxylate transporter receptor subunit TctC